MELREQIARIINENLGVLKWDELDRNEDSVYYSTTDTILVLIKSHLPELAKEAREKTPAEIHSCAFCGGAMSKNPHPNAGKPPDYLTVGTQYECIPCAIKSRHSWAERAMKAESKLEEMKDCVKLSKDQSLPKVPSGVGYCRNMQRNMLEAGFRKVEVEK